MDKLARQNSEWIGRMKTLLREGWGVEDIAIKTKTKLEHVQSEVRILRASGELNDLFKRSEK